MSYPPEFKISANSCRQAKKKPSHDYLVNGGFDISCIGVRKAEGGVRSTTYKSCFDEVLCGADNYRPLFWWSDSDKDMYRKNYGIIRSDCYEVWGMVRTGYAGCPFNKKFFEEIDLIKIFEPKRYKAMWAVFGQSYEYTMKFLEFRAKMKIKSREIDEDQIKVEGV